MLPNLIALLAACGGAPRCVDTADCFRGCRFTALCDEDCENGVDDDGDGRIDCDDVTCAPSGLCQEVCDDLIDNDGDLQIDEAPCPAWTCPVERCDGSDADGDGLVGCEDPDCAYGPSEGNCTDGVDDDCDGLVDCDDPDCPTLTAEDCWREAATDADCDGLDVAHDPDCDGADERAEQCRDGRDDDGDGLVDCEDGDCVGTPFCDEVCDNHADDDLDGLTDCWDDDCWGPECVGATAARVEGGLGRWGSASRGGFGSYGGAAGRWLGVMRVEQVRGTLRVADGYGGTGATCTWTVAGASARTGRAWWRSSFLGGYGSEITQSPFARCEITIGEPCGPLPQHVLPRQANVSAVEARFASAIVPRRASYSSWVVRYGMGGGAPWYVPSEPVELRTSVTHWSESDGGSIDRGRLRIGTARFDLGTGDWYYAAPAP